MAARGARSVNPLRLVSELIATGKADTVYRDVYLDRAHSLLDATLPFAEFKRIEGERAQLAELSAAIGRAMDAGNWPQVKKLSASAPGAAPRSRWQGTLMDLGREVYAASDIRLDPFSPGLQSFAQVRANNGGVRQNLIRGPTG